MTNPTLTANSPSAGSIAWSSFSLQYAGVTYSLSAGSTSSRYVYWILTSPTNIQTSDSIPTLSDDDTLLFINRNGNPIFVLDRQIIDGALIAPGTFDSTLFSGTLSSAQIADGSITNPKLADGSINHQKLTADSINASNIVDGSVGTPEIADGSVTDTKLAINSVTASKIADQAVTYDHIGTGSLPIGVSLTAGAVANNAGRIVLTNNSLQLITRDGGGADTSLVNVNTSGVVAFTNPTLTNPILDLQTTVDYQGKASSLDTSFGALAHGVAFGTPTSGEGIRSNRRSADSVNSAANRSGLDFITNFIPRLQIYQNGIVNIGTDLQVAGQSIPRGVVAYGYRTIGGTTPTNGAETAAVWTQFLTTIVTGRKYRLKWWGTLSRSDNQADLAILRMRFTSTTDGTWSGNGLDTNYFYVPVSFVGTTAMMEVVFQGAVSASNPPGGNAYTTVTAGNRGFIVTVEKNSGSGNAATINATGRLILEDLGT